MNNYIGISEDKSKHILNVARKAYSLAKEWGETEEFARKAYMAGFLHDTGYEFSSKASEHPTVSAELLELTGLTDGEFTQAILNHGNPYIPVNRRTALWYVLNAADMMIDSTGKEVTIDERCEDIATRYGRQSEAFKNAVQLSNLLKVYVKQKRKAEIYIQISGTRKCTDALLVSNVIEKFCEMLDIGDAEVHLVEGEAKGVDTYAKEYAKEHKWIIHPFKADFETIGKKAGPIRIARMHSYISNFENKVCLSIWDGSSRGTFLNLVNAASFHNKMYCYNYVEHRWLTDEEIANLVAAEH